MGEDAEAIKRENHFLRMLTVFLVMMVAYVHYQSAYSGGFILWGYEFVALVYGFGRFAMPIFFMVSGYFLFSKDGHSEKSLWRKTKRTLILLIFLKVFYFCMDLVLVAFGIIAPDWMEIMYHFILFGDSSAHQWFVLSLLAIYICHIICQKKNWDFKVLIPFGILLLILDMIVGNVLPVMGVTSIFGMNPCDLNAGTYVFIGLFFFQAGYYMHKHDDWLRKNFSTLALAIIALLGLIINGFELFAMLNCGFYDGSLNKGPNLYFGTLFFAIALFALTFRIKENQLRCRPLEWMGRNIMPWMYVFIMVGTYPLQLTVLSAASGMRDNFVVYQIIGPIVCILLDIIAALIMYFILEKLFGKKKTAKPAENSVNSVN